MPADARQLVRKYFITTKSLKARSLGTRIRQTFHIDENTHDSSVKKMDKIRPTEGSKKPDEGDDHDNTVTDDDEDKSAAAAADTDNDYRPRGFDRGLDPERIIGATASALSLQSLVPSWFPRRVLFLRILKNNSRYLLS